jgi:hypothetical protein
MMIYNDIINRQAAIVIAYNVINKRILYIRKSVGRID